MRWQPADSLQPAAESSGVPLPAGQGGNSSAHRADAGAARVAGRHERRGEHITLVLMCTHGGICVGLEMEICGRLHPLVWLRSRIRRMRVVEQKSIRLATRAKTGKARILEERWCLKVSLAKPV